MRRSEFKRFLERKKAQEQQKEQFEKSTDYFELQEMIDKAGSGQSIDIPKTLTALEQFHHESEAFEQDYKALYAERSLHLGSALNGVRKYVDRLYPRTWVKWRNQHITFISARKCENLMKLAKEQGVDEFTHLGISALIDLNAAIDDLYPESTYIKRFHAFFDESTYPYRKYQKNKEVKKLIAIHAFEVKAIREGLLFDISNVIKLGEYKGVLNDKLIEDLLQHQQTGSADERLKVLIIGKGKPSKLSTNTKSKSKQLAIDRDTIKLMGTVDNYLKNFEKLNEIQIEILEKLIKKLDNLYWDKITFDLAN